jgi:biopolymer transport protein ExbD
MVLQLLMFFMMCVNFVNEQNNETIKLPDAQTAQPMDKTENDVLFVNINYVKDEEAGQEVERHDVLVVGEPYPMDPLAEDDADKRPSFKRWLRQKYDAAQLLAKGGPVNTIIIIRAHKDAVFGEIFKVMTYCKRLGYRRLQLRTIKRTV